MDAKLKERAQQVAQLRNSNTRFTDAQLREIGEVHHLLTGRNIACISCNVYGLINEISSRLIQEPLIIKDMKNAKGRFKQNAGSKQVIRHNPKTGITTVITPENINEGDNFEWVASSKDYAHNVEEIPSEGSKKTEATTEAKTTAPVSSKKKKKAARAAATQTPAPEVTPAKTTVEPTTEAE